MKKILFLILAVALVMTTFVGCGKEAVYYIQYELVGGTNSSDNVRSFVAGDLNIELHSATKDGFTFGGWYTDSDFEQSISEITVAKSYRLYAKWVDADGRVLSFEDDFTGTELDSEIWTTEKGNGSNGWGNQEVQYYKAENVVVNNGILQIIAKTESAGNQNYTSGRIKSSFSQAYGRFEAKIKLPSGQGLWPAFWLLPASDVNGTWPVSGEIDIMEANCKNIDQTSSALHYANGGNHAFTNFVNDKIEDFDLTEWHTYAVEWGNGTIKWFVDDTLIGSMQANEWNINFSSGGDKPFDTEFYIILNLAVGGWYVNQDVPLENFESASMQVDYVRVYK